MSNNPLEQFLSFDDLETPVSEISTKAEKPAETFPCMRCSGTGQYTWGYHNPQTGKCRDCKGVGHFKTSPFQRQKNRTQAAARKVSKGDENLAEFKLAKPEVFDFLAERTWSDFCASLLGSIRKYGDLTENQLKATYRMMAKAADKAAAASVSAPERVQLDLTVVFEKFAKAREAGLKRPVMRFDGVTISRAPDHGRNAGFLYAKAGGEYAGKIDATGKWFPVRSCPAEVTGRLEAIQGDVLEAARQYGHNTGSCCCCGRTLTDPKSIAAGIGPICESKFF